MNFSRSTKMSKYRIIQRSSRLGPIYFAQVKLLGFFWVDLPWCSTGGYGEWLQGGESPSRQLHLVENYIAMYRDGFGAKDKVVKEFN